MPKVFVELFSGQGVLATELRKLGCVVLEWDIAWGQLGIFDPGSSLSVEGLDRRWLHLGHTLWRAMQHMDQGT